MSRLFWSWFESAAADLRSRMLSGQIGGVFSEIEGKSRANGFAFGLELFLEGDTATLILTPEGDAAGAAMIDRFVVGRAAIPGWRILGRRPKRSISDARLLAWRLQGVDVGDAVFGLDPREDGWRVTMVADAPPDRVVRTLGAFLDHALGEEVSMARVKELIAAGPAVRPVVPLTAVELVDQLAGVPSDARPGFGGPAPADIGSQAESPNLLNA